jgi:hypothetical protein
MTEMVSESSLSDLSLETLLELVDKKIVQQMGEITHHLESLTQENTLQKEELKQETTKILNFYQMRLFARILGVLVNPFDAQASAKTSGLLTQINEIAQHLKALWAGEMVKDIDARANEIRQQIAAKEQAIKEQIAKRQHEISAAIQKATQRNQVRPS